MSKLTLIKVDGTVVVGELPKGGSLSVLQSAVGGSIETLPGMTRYEGARCEAYANEEGLVRGLPLNEKATELWQAALGYKPELGPEGSGKFWYVPQVRGNLAIVQASSSGAKK